MEAYHALTGVTGAAGRLAKSIPGSLAGQVRRPAYMSFTPGRPGQRHRERRRYHKPLVVRRIG
ncbi:MAG: hypothetical protein C0P61_004800 [Bacillota bacterium]